MWINSLSLTITIHFQPEKVLYQNQKEIGTFVVPTTKGFITRHNPKFQQTYMSLIKSKIFFGGILSLLIIIFQSCATTQNGQEEYAQKMLESSQSAPVPTDSTYKIGIGDEIEILVWEQPNFNTQTTVSNMGTIAIPLIGEIEASGLSHSEFKEEINKRLSEYIKGEINLTVSIRSTDSMLVSVFGMVTRPDNYPIGEQTSIFKVLSMAGGTSEEANIRNVRIYRKNSNPHYTTLDLTEYLDSGQQDATAVVYPGDIVYVPRKENAVREVSEFLRDVVLLFGIFRVIN